MHRPADPGSQRRISRKGREKEVKEGMGVGAKPSVSRASTGHSSISSSRLGLAPNVYSEMVWSEWPATDAGSYHS